MADKSADYIELCCDLVRSTEHRHTLITELAEKAHHDLFDDRKYVREEESFLLAAVQQCREVAEAMNALNIQPTLGCPWCDNLDGTH